MLTLLAALAIGAAQAAAPAEPTPASQSFAALAVAQPESVVVDCAVGDAEFLTDCKVIGEAGAAGDEALQLAGQIPTATARPVAVNGRISIRLMVNP
jgi:hypothetical protein